MGGVNPACAGMIPRCAGPMRARRGKPRVCGDDPAILAGEMLATT